MESIFFDNLRRITGDPRESHFLLAVSGGIDSTVMVHLFASYDLSFDIAHCNFHLREEESDADMQFVSELSVFHHRKILIKEFDTLQIQKNSGKSIEMIARELRYGWFNELSDNYDFICTAHHANDNAETLLLNLIRGCGYKGINGIPEQNGKFIRPLLHFSSKEIKAYSTVHNLSYQIDRTNLSEIYHRNKIRHSILPILEEINPDIIATLSQDIEIFNRQYHFYTFHLQEVIKQVVQKNCATGSTDIDFETLQKMEDGALILYEILNPYGFSSVISEQIFKSETIESGKRYFSSTNILVKDRKFLRIYPFSEEMLPLRIDNMVDFEHQGFTIELHPFSSPIEFDNDPNTLYVDADKFQFPLILRQWQEGDYFYPIGMHGKRKKVSDYFIQQKIDIYQKTKIKILCFKDQIVWIAGYRSDERFKISATTKEYYLIKKI